MRVVYQFVPKERFVVAYFNVYAVFENSTSIPVK
jgi:hypothetical protein